MSTPDTQLFRARSSSRTVPIPTRQDPKSRQRVIRWKDIQLYFIDAHCVKHGEDVVLFLTDDDLEDLVPLRIAHHAGVVLEVLSMDDVQSESTPVATSSSTLALEPGSNRFLSATSLGEASSMANDVVALRIADTDTNQALVVRSHGMSSGAFIQELPTMMGDDHSQSWTRSNMGQQGQIRQLQAQVEDIRLSQEQIQGQVDKILEDLQQAGQRTLLSQEQIQGQADKIQVDLQRVDQRALVSQQQIQDQADKILEELQQIDQRTLLSHQQLQGHKEDVLQVTQQLSLQRDQFDNALQEMAQASHQRHEQIDRILQDLHQQCENAEQMTQQSDQQRQHLDTVLHEVRQANQKTQHSQQKTQKQVEDVLQEMQRMGQEMQEIKLQVQNTQQLYEELRQPLQNRDETPRQHGHSSLEGPRQKTLQIFSRMAHIQRRVPAILAKSNKDLPVPRLFIVLPRQTNMADGQEKLSSMHFRLYFLCECGAHTIPEKYNNMHVVHLANHPGYDMVNSDDFFQKYGSYLLTMMHMVKYGVKTNGMLVPPLLGINHTGDVGTDPHYLGVIKQNISDLVDDTIVHILGEIGTGHMEDNTAIRHNLTSSDLEQITSYLDVEDGGSFTGDLCMMTTQDRCVWICNDHYTEVVLRQLKDIIDISGGEYINSEVKVKVDTTYESLTTQFRDILTQLSHSQKPEGNFINCLNGIECLSIDFGRLSMTVHGISRGKVDDMTINIGRLSDLTMDDLDFIQQCHPVLVRIIRTPQKNDEDKLTMILQRNTMITELHIGCYVRRVFPVINLVISAREELLQIGGQSALRTVQVMKDGLIPCDINTVNDDSGLVTAMVSFTDGSTTFDIGSHVKLRKQLTDDDGEFLHQYGWSMKTLIVSESFGDRHAELLDAVTLERGSKIATLHLTLSALTSKGLDSIDRIIKRAPNPPTIRLFLDRLCEVDQLEKAIRLLERYKDRMVGLRLNGGLKTTWLPRITQVFPTRDMFPLLEELTIGGQVDSTRFANTSWEWILFMVSVPPQPLKGLKAFCLENTTFFYWHSIFSAIDLSALEVVSVKGCRIYGKGDLTLLAKRIADGESQSRPFRVLDLSNCHIFDPDDGPSMLRILREKAPQVEVVGLDQ